MLRGTIDRIKEDKTKRTQVKMPIFIILLHYIYIFPSINTNRVSTLLLHSFILSYVCVTCFFKYGIT